MGGPVAKATRIPCKTAMFVTVVVPGLSSSSSASSSSASYPQDSSSTSPSPASLRSDDTYYQAPRDRRDDPDIKNKTKMRTTIEQRETACETYWHGWRSSQRLSKMQKCQHSQTLLMTQIRNVLRKWHPGSTVFLLTSRKTKIARSA